MGHGDKIEEWLETLVNIIQVWVWSLWESKGGLSFVELDNIIVRCINVLFQFKGGWVAVIKS